MTLLSSPRLQALVLALSSCGLLAACAGDGRQGRRPGAGMAAQAQQQQQARAEAFSAGGYQPAESAPLSLALQQWVLRGESVPLSLAYPSSGRALPLIVYLPGLGESTQAGAPWREAWARAGYAVLCLQPLAEDAQAWSSELARAADFKGLGRRHYDVARIPARLQMLAAALAEARQRAAAGDSLWSRVEFTRLGLAGFELGAQTALALPTPSLPFQAVIALSPLTAERPATDPTTALLVIGSASDGDPLGLFTPAQSARALFEGGAAGQLLWLRQASHASLAGSGVSEALAEAGGRAGETGRGRGGKGGGGMGGGGAGGGGGKGRGGMGGPQGQQGPPGAQSGQSVPQAGPAMGQAETVAAISGTSLAFFDARLRQRPEAQAWLDQAAREWLRELGEWRQR